MPGWWPCPECCFKGGCVIQEDYFGRPDNTLLGSGWKEILEDSEIDNGQLLIPAGGIVMATRPNPFRSHTGHVWATMKAPTNGDKFRVLIQYDDDDDSFLFGECEVTDNNGSAWLRVGEGDKTGSSIFHEIEAGTMGDKVDTVLSVCRSQTGIYAECEVSVIAWECVPPPVKKPWKSGLMNAGGGDLHFDNFQFLQHWLTDPDCPKCECDCDGYCVPKTITLTIFASDLCSCLDGKTVTLTWRPGQLPEFVWQGSAMLQDHLCTGTELHEYRLTCADNPQDWTLECLQGPFCSACDDNGFFGKPDTYSCDPFVLEWLGGYCDESGGQQCGYAMKVTA